MIQDESDRKLKLLYALAKELGVRLQSIDKKKRGEDFRAERFQALAEIAGKFADSMTGSTPSEYSRAADVLVNEYWNNNTNRTEKSEKGGTPNGYKQIVKCGHDAGKIYERLQQRIDFWKSERAREGVGEKEMDRLRRKDLAERYIQIRDPKKHNGRPGREIDGVPIRASTGGTNRDSTSWEVARLFTEYGQRVLSDDVLDAILDNGGAAHASARGGISVADLVGFCEQAIVENQLRPDEMTLVRQALALLKRGAA